MASIAIVVAIYNGEATLDQCLASIETQSIPPSQLIVMDGGSKDGTVEILSRRSGMFSYWESRPDGGIYDAWNKALSHLTADWVWFIGCDDCLADAEVLSRMAALLDKTEAAVGLVYGKVAMVARSGRVSDVIGRPWADVRRRMQYSMVIPHTGLLARRALFERVGEFDAQYRIAGDYDWFMRAAAESGVRFTDDLLVNAGDEGLSGASETQVRTVREFGLICERQGRRRSLGWRWLLLKCQVKRLRAPLGAGGQGLVVDLFRSLT
uniref:Glycosyltransferase n=1 Tax=Phenylobacterium glaciei TaxID=2803784 RepID=A0A974SA61_9CAUL|nr:glycosyltransferase [Phenylobacterium glaciei]